MNKFLKNVKAYLTGNLRHRLYYSRFKFLLRPLILEQFEWRLKAMNKICYNQGSCIKCGCVTTALQMADKACAGDCYPPFLGKLNWTAFKEGLTTVDSEKNIWMKRSVQVPGNARVMYETTVYKNDKKVSKYYETKSI